MKKYSVITTYYCNGCQKPSSEDLKNKFNYDGNLDDIYVNFSNEFDPFNMEKIPDVGISRRKDLVYGKIFLLKEFIENNILGKYEYLCHIDYSDTKFCGSCNDMVDKFIQTKKDILISTEKTAWPSLDTIISWTNKKIVDNEFTFLNSGSILSKTEVFYNILIELINLCETTNIDFWDDQGVWQYYDINIKELNKDSKCEYFFSTALLDDSYYEIKNNKIKTKFGSYPFLIHDNSSFNLNLIQKI